MKEVFMTTDRDREIARKALGCKDLDPSSVQEDRVTKALSEARAEQVEKDAVIAESMNYSPNSGSGRASKDISRRIREQQQN